MSKIGRDARIHPCQKPVCLYEWLMEKYAKESDHFIHAEERLKNVTKQEDWIRNDSRANG